MSRFFNIAPEKGYSITVFTVVVKHWTQLQRRHLRADILASLRDNNGVYIARCKVSNVKALTHLLDALEDVRKICADARSNPAASKCEHIAEAALAQWSHLA